MPANTTNILERALKPGKFETDPDSQTSGKQWLHWRKTFENYLSALAVTDNDSKLQILTNFVSPEIFEDISEQTSYSEALSSLQDLYVKPKSEVFSRHLLQTRKQESGETLDQYLQILKMLAKDCHFHDVTALQYKEEAIRDSFINGLQSSYIRQRLLESSNLDLKNAFSQARSLEMAHSHADSYKNQPHQNIVAASVEKASTENSVDFDETLSAHMNSSVSSSTKCYFCGLGRHPRSKCPARDSICNKCGRKGHWAKVCRSTEKSSSTNVSSAILAANSELNSNETLSKNDCLRKSKITIQIDGVFTRNGLVDSGSSNSFIDYDFARRLKIKISEDTKNSTIRMAATSLKTQQVGSCAAKIQYGEHEPRNVYLGVLKGLCADILIGHDLLNEHSSLLIQFGGSKPPLRICGVSMAEIDPPSLFSDLTPDCRPVADRSRSYSKEDQIFIQAEIDKLLEEGIIEECQSPWRAQVLVTGGGNQKKRVVVDYSRTVNRFTLLDAYPLPNISEMARNVASYQVFSTLDLKSAYHQVPIREEERKYTGFEAGSKLYQFLKIPFGVTNGVSCFQRTVDSIITKESLKDTFVYVDNITVCGQNQESHDRNLQKLYDSARKYNLTFNHDKSIISVSSICLLGYQISPGQIRPDPERLEPLVQLSPPEDQKSLKRVLGLFSYYSQWIPSYSEVVRPLVKTESFPITAEALKSFKELKKRIEESVIHSIDPDIPLVVETDASDFALAASLNQAGRPVAFFSRTLSKSEQN